MSLKFKLIAQSASLAMRAQQRAFEHQREIEMRARLSVPLTQSMAERGVRIPARTSDQEF
jgi:hypothetical protein